MVNETRIACMNQTAFHHTKKLHNEVTLNISDIIKNELYTF